ncbi:tail fiber domain-containing protein [Plantibacter sp. ME-Dv--P-095]|uniref:tail fiber domain-containing protein n=1 Tax=Plantibacter sp. ME-Dv--P-095 TaxID=3040299 RepID=UPI00254F1E13|nr:tail fiber domain-containing protein [Plantibacter sp. ME-Dv--P-095]
MPQSAAFRSSTPSDLGFLIDILDRIEGRLQIVEAPSGEQIGQTIERLRVLVEELSAQVDTLVEDKTYLRADIDQRIANPPSGSNVTGNVTASGSVTANGNVAADGNVISGAAIAATTALSGQDLYATNAPGFNITGGRVAAWLENATGRLGTASSSRRYKQDEAPATIDPAAVLTIHPKTFHYIDEVRKRDDPAFEHYVGPEYVVAEEVGFIAEDLADARLDPFVVWREVDGAVVPDGVNYAMIAVAQQAVLLSLDARLRAHGM